MFNLGINNIRQKFNDVMLTSYFIIFLILLWYFDKKKIPVFSGIYVVFMSHMNYYYYVLE